MPASVGTAPCLPAPGAGSRRSGRHSLPAAATLPRASGTEGRRPRAAAAGRPGRRGRPRVKRRGALQGVWLRSCRACAPDSSALPPRGHAGSPRGRRWVGNGGACGRCGGRAVHPELPRFRQGPDPPPASSFVRPTIAPRKWWRGR